jgi:hypothetical protein
MELGAIIGCMLGFLFFNSICSYKKEPMIFHNIIIRGFHIHHWMIFLGLFIISLPVIFYGGYGNISGGWLGICLGSILQGLTFRDAFQL